MESVTGIHSQYSQRLSYFSLSSEQGDLKAEALIIETSLESDALFADKVSLGFEKPSNDLAVLAQSIVEKLNELLKDSLPKGLESLKPKEVTPEATADHIVKAVTALFPIFAEQNPELQGEELLNKFMETVRSGVEQGYNDAYHILEDLGAFQFEGVREAIEATKKLIDEKLLRFEEYKRKEFGSLIAPSNTEDEDGIEVVQ